MVACCFPQQLKDNNIDPSKLLDLREDDEFLYKSDSEDDDAFEEDVERIGEKLKTDKGTKCTHKLDFALSLPN